MFNLKNNIYSHLKIYNNINEDYSIQLIEIVDERLYSNKRELQIIKNYIDAGFNVLNEKIGETLFNKDYFYNKSVEYNNNKTKEYNKWNTNIYNKAKKLGISTKEYKSTYKIEPFNGKKKYIN